MTFEWEDINDEVREKLVFVSFRRNTGLGEYGAVIAITKNGQEYMVGLEGCADRQKEDEILERFLGENLDSVGQCSYCENLKGFRKTEKWLYKWIPISYIYVRKDFFDKLIPEIEGSESSPEETVRRLLDPQDKRPKIFIQYHMGKWESLVMERQRIKEIEEILKETERKLEEKSYEELLKDTISFDEFKKRIKAELSELEEQEGQ